MADGRIKEAKVLVADAEKALKTGLFKWKPDHEYAAELLDKAANLFKLARDHGTTIETYLRAAECYRLSGALFHAAKALENAAQSAKELKQGDKFVQLTKEAARLYRTHGVHDAAAIALEKSAKQAESNGDFEGALELWVEVVDIREDEDQLRQAKIPLQKAIGLCVRQKHWAKAIELLDKQTEVMSKINSTNLFQQNILSKVGVHLLCGDFVAAEKTYMNALAQRPSIANSDESAVVNRLLEAFESNNQEALKHVLAEQAITFLDNEIALAFKHITIDEESGGGGSSAKPVRLESSSLPSLVVKKSVPSDPVAARAELFGCKTKKPSVGDSERGPAPAPARTKKFVKDEEDEDPFDADKKESPSHVPEAVREEKVPASQPLSQRDEKEEEEEEEEEDPFAARSAPAPAASAPAFSLSGSDKREESEEEQEHEHEEQENSAPKKEEVEDDLC